MRPLRAWDRMDVRQEHCSTPVWGSLAAVHWCGLSRGSLSTRQVSVHTIKEGQRMEAQWGCVGSWGAAGCFQRCWSWRSKAKNIALPFLSICKKQHWTGPPLLFPLFFLHIPRLSTRQPHYLTQVGQLRPPQAAETIMYRTTCKEQRHTSSLPAGHMNKQHEKTHTWGDVPRMCVFMPFAQYFQHNST